MLKGGRKALLFAGNTNAKLFSLKKKVTFFMATSTYIGLMQQYHIKTAVAVWSN